jgi:hypothetical protein
MAQALALVQMTWRDVDATTWRIYLRFIADRAEGLAGGLVLKDAAGYLNGVALYEVEQDLQNGRVLTIHVFTAVDIANSAAPVQVLLDAVLKKAADLDCAGVQVRLARRQAILRGHLHRLGLSDHTSWLWKTVQRSPSKPV